MDKSEWMESRCSEELRNKGDALPAVPSGRVRFWYAPRSFEMCDGPSICMDNPTGGDPIVVLKIANDAAFPVWAQYLQALVDAANQRFEQLETGEGS